MLDSTIIRGTQISGRPPAPLWLRVLSFAVLVYLVLSVYGPLGRIVDPYLVIIGAFPVLLAASFLIVLIHEAGHAAIAALCGWRVSMVVVGSLAVRPTPFRLFVGHSLWTQGAALVVPRNDYGEWIAVMAGGALANLLCGAGALIYAYSISGSESFAGLLGAGFGKLSIAIGLMNLIPFGITAGRSDGGHIYDAISGRDLEPFIRCARVMDAICRGRRPRDWPHDIMERLESDAAAPDAKGHESLLLYAYYLDRSEADNARSALARAQQKLGSVDELKIEEAFFKAHVEADFANARSILDRVSSRLRRKPSYLRAEAVLLLAEGNIPAARKVISAARRKFRSYPFSTPDDHELLDELERKANALEGPAPIATAGVNA